MLMIEEGPGVYGIHDNDINRIVQDYRSGRIDDAAFRTAVTQWKENWHRRIASIVPGHSLEVLVDANSRVPVFRLTPSATRNEQVVDPTAALHKHLPEKSRGPSR